MRTILITIVGNFPFHNTSSHLYKERMNIEMSLFIYIYKCMTIVSSETVVDIFLIARLNRHL